jgi:hypothetical protein
MRKTGAFLFAFLVAAGAAAEQKPVETHKYIYSADRFVDPFIPSVGAGSAAAPQGFEPAGAEVGGLISTARGKLAIIKVSTGGTYIVKGGHLVDHSGHIVPNYLARINPDSVVVWSPTGPERFVYPIKMRHEKVTE